MSRLYWLPRQIERVVSLVSLRKSLHKIGILSFLNIQKNSSGKSCGYSVSTVGCLWTTDLVTVIRFELFWFSVSSWVSFVCFNEFACSSWILHVYWHEVMQNTIFLMSEIPILMVFCLSWYYYCCNPPNPPVFSYPISLDPFTYFVRLFKRPVSGRIYIQPYLL